MGADHVINHRESMIEQLKAINIPGVNYCFNCFDADKNWDDVLACILPLGKITIISGIAGLDIFKCMMKRISIFPEIMFSRAILDFEPEKQRDILNLLSEYYEKGILISIQNRSFPFSQLKEAHEFQDSGTAIGKITLEVKF